MSTREARSIAIVAYWTARSQGKSPNEAAQVAWRAVRRPHERAPSWDRKWCANTGCRGSFRSPLGDALKLGTGEFGHHAKKWPITLQAERECRNVRESVTSFLERAMKCRQSARKTRWELVAA